MEAPEKRASPDDDATSGSARAWEFGGTELG